jgi:hypothetical protein
MVARPSASPGYPDLGGNSSTMTRARARVGAVQVLRRSWITPARPLQHHSELLFCNIQSRRTMILQ